MKKLIYQYYIGNGFLPDWVKESSKRFKKYAEKHNADYIFDTKVTFSSECFYFEHLKILYDDKFQEYDLILYADVDIIIENFEENIFDTKIKDVGMIPEYQAKGMIGPPTYMLKGYAVKYKTIANKFNLPYIKPVTVESPYLMFNTGVILWSKDGLSKAKSNFMDWKKWYNSIDEQIFKIDQAYITGQVTKHLDYTEMALKWNCFPMFRFEKGMEPKDAIFVHYTGGKKKYIEEIYGKFKDEN